MQFKKDDKVRVINGVEARSTSADVGMGQEGIVQEDGEDYIDVRMGGYNWSIPAKGLEIIKEN